LFLYALPLGIQLSRGDIVIKAKARTWSYLAVVVPFVDIDVIVDHHWLYLSSHNGVDWLTNPRQYILLHNKLSNIK